ncbi:BON domain-containing protein [Vibrio gallicus]|uniref:BON domain-containing protein n=1 Tax=Vibrio gallicus TaxID=190897 RepID=UPI0021C33CA0|nr:BON domain-containing protein [Vibrio gallicus]
MLYTRQLKLVILTLFASFALSGCAGMLTLGSDTPSVSDVRSTSQVWQDNNIEFEAAALSNKPPFRGHSRIAANAYRGRVVLIGQIATEQQKQQVEEQVKLVKGVNKVYNQLQVGPVVDVSQMSRDSWITTKVKSFLTREAKLKGASIKVITENNEVFLFGYVTAEHANIATEVTRNVSGVKHVIRGFVVAENAIDDVDKPSEPERREATVEDIIESTPTQATTTNENSVTNQTSQADESDNTNSTDDDDAVAEDSNQPYIDSSDRITEEDL